MTDNFKNKPITLLKVHQVATTSPHTLAIVELIITHVQIIGIETDKKQT